jgi:hypothetical protein
VPHSPSLATPPAAFAHGTVRVVRPPEPHDAWLCKPAAPDAAMDDPDFYSPDNDMGRATIQILDKAPAAAGTITETHSILLSHIDLSTPLLWLWVAGDWLPPS